MLPEDEVRKIIKDHGFNIANMSYRITDDGLTFEYRMVLQTRNARDISMLSSHLLNIKKVKSFQLSPTGD